MKSMNNEVKLIKTEGKKNFHGIVGQRNDTMWQMREGYNDKLMRPTTEILTQ